LGYYRKDPLVCFKVEFASAANAGDELSRIMENHLRAQFGPIRREQKLWWWLPQLIVLKIGQKELSVGWHKRKFKDGEWIVFVSPSDISTLLTRLRGQKQVTDTQELMLVSRGIHALLASAAGITNIRWYFRAFRREGRKTVATPDELPWTET
jgi:hypothetical protein